MKTGAALAACSGSTTTVPLKREGSRGRRTNTDVVYGWPSASPVANHSSST